MKLLEEKLIINFSSKFVELENGYKNYKISNSKLLFQADDHSITKFETTSNNQNCNIIVNCGLTPPQIFFEFEDRSEYMEIDHDYQTEVIEALKKIEQINLAF